jgi:hypothetical protein
MRREEGGFSLVELLVATAITVTVTALACALALEANRAWRVDGARIDLHQRARVAVDSITRALMESGAGPHTGTALGPLLRQLPPIVPRRTGRLRADAPGVFRTDAFTVVRVMPEAEHAELLLPLAAGGGTIEIAPSPTCALPACGFEVGSTALVTSADGMYDLFTVLAVAGRTLSLRHHGTGAHPSYPAGSPVLVAEVTTFHHDVASQILRRYDGDSADSPSVDDVVGVRVEYYGGAEPPRWPRGTLGVANCLYESDGTYRSTLLPILPAPVPLAVPLSGVMLSDGPWCGSGGNQFDADLLRVRQVRVTLRLQASDPAVRGADPAWFRVAGVASRGASMVQDLTVVAGVGPRNLRTGW